MKKEQRDLEFERLQYATLRTKHLFADGVHGQNHGED